MMRVVEEVAARCAGTVGDVLRLALPPRHARAEKSEAAAAAEKDAAQEVDPPETAPRDSAADEPAPDTPDTDEADEADGAAKADEAADTEGAAGTAAVPTEAPPEPRPGDRYPGLGALLSRAGSATGPVPRATITLDSADPWTTVTADALADLGPEQGALVIAPDRRDVDRLSRILTERGIGHEILAGTEGPEALSHLRRILRGATRIVLGNRSAASPLCRAGPRDLLGRGRRPPRGAPRAVPARAHRAPVPLPRGALRPAVPVGEPTRSLRALTNAGYLARLDPVPAPVRTVRAHIVAMDQYLRDREGASGRSRLPQEAMRVIRRGLERGPVLVQVPRSGYVPAIACTFCGTRAQCPHCAAQLSIAGRSGHLHCRVCGRREDGYRCPECDRTQVRAMVIGSTRTAEELHRAFPDSPLRVAGGAHDTLTDTEVPPTRSWSPRPAPSPCRRSASPRRCCWTRTPCWAGRPSMQMSRRSGAGAMRSPWSAPRTEERC